MAKAKPALHSDFGTPGWYAVMAGPKMEFVAADYLRREEIRAWVPFERITKWRNMWGKQKLESRRVPLFPRYLFVRVLMGDIARVNECVGVSTVVYQGEYPFAIPQEIMDELMARADWLGCLGEMDKTKRELFEAGSVVRVSDEHPSLAGHERVVSVDSGDSVRVLLDLLGAEVEVSIAPHFLTLVE